MSPDLILESESESSLSNLSMSRMSLLISAFVNADIPIYVRIRDSVQWEHKRKESYLYYWRETDLIITFDVRHLQYFEHIFRTIHNAFKMLLGGFFVYWIRDCRHFQDFSSVLNLPSYLLWSTQKNCWDINSNEEVKRSMSVPLQTFTVCKAPDWQLRLLFFLHNFSLYLKESKSMGCCSSIWKTGRKH